MKRYLVFISIPLTIFILVILLFRIVGKSIISTVYVMEIIRQVPPEIWWILFAYILIYFTFDKLKRLFSRYFFTREKRTGQKGKIESLADLIGKARKGKFYREKLSRHLGYIALGILIYKHKSTSLIMRENLKINALDISPEILSYVKAGLNINRSFQEALPIEKEHTPEDLDPINVVEYLEKEMGER